MGFGDFESICRKSALPVCSVVGPTNPISESTTGIQATCYARSIELANTIIFEAATDFIHILALGMAAIMVLHVRSKFTAVGEHRDQVPSSACVLTCGVLNIGRKEITTFFYIYMALTMTSLILDAGVIPPGSGTFPYFVAVQNGFTSALCTCLLINGFVGFQLYEDGTRQSVWLLRGSSTAMFVISGAVSILTFKGKAGLGPTNTVGLFVVLYLINGICLFIYLVMQILLVTNTLQDRWPLGDISFGVFFFVIGQVILYVFSDTICNAVSHYLDGLFFATICNLLAVMMVYKVSLRGGNCSWRKAADVSPSTGILLPRKILNSASARNKEIGKSKSLFLKMTEEVPFITTVLRSMQAARTLSAIHTMVASATKVHVIPIPDIGSSMATELFWSTGAWLGGQYRARGN